MAPQKAAQAGAKPPTAARAKRKSKSRTQVSDTSTSDESSSDESSDTSSLGENSSHAVSDEGSGDDDNDGSTTPRRASKVLKNPRSTAQRGASRPTKEGSEDPTTTPDAREGDENDDEFSAFYLRSVASELAEDLDKIRAANDFSEARMPMLIRALKQGEAVFSEEEKRAVMRGSTG